MNIRKVSKYDSDEMKKLHQELYSEEDKKYVDLTEENFECHPITLVIEEGSHLIGYISGEVLGWESRLEGYINDLFVKEEFRNKGYGKELVKKFEEESLKSSNNVFIFVSIDPSDNELNPTSFYEKLNYKVMQYPWLVKKL